MTVRRRALPSLGFDLRALPITVKFAVGLGVVMVISAIVISRLVVQLVNVAQINTAFADSETFSRTQALRLVDRLGQEIISMSRMGGSASVQSQLLSYVVHEPPEGDQEEPVLLTNPTLTLQVQTFRETHGEFDTVAVFDTHGFILAIDPVPENIEALSSPGQWDWYPEVLNDRQGRTLLLNPFDDQLTGQTGIHIFIPIYNERDQSQLLGIIYGIWNMSNALDVVDLGGSREGVVAQDDGSVLISLTQARGTKLPAALISQIESGTDSHSGENASNAHVQGSGGSLTFTDASFSTWLYGYTRLSDLNLGDETVNALDWVIIVRQPLASIQSSANLLLNRLFLALGASALVLTVLVLGLARSILGPLNRLTNAAIAIESGEMDTEIPRLSEDEIGQLANILRTLVGQLVYRVRQLRAAVQVSRAASLTLDITPMLESIVKAMEEQFGYPETRIYLVESSGRHARLAAAAGGESERMLRSAFRLPVDETSLVGRCILLKDAQVGGVGGHLLDAGLVTERSEIAMPLLASSGVIGAMYIFAGRGNVFVQEDIDVLSLVLDQVSSAIENARLFEQSSANLAEIEALNRQLTRQAWEDYVGDNEGFRHTMDPAQQWPEISAAVRQQNVVRADVSTNEDGRSILAVPLILRGEAIGTIAVTRPAEEGWTQEEISLIESIAGRMITIAEGLRLVEESAKVAERERTVNDISAHLLQRAASVENVLQAALGQFSGALGSDHVSLRIGVPPVEGDRQITSGSSSTEEDASSGNGTRERDTTLASDGEDVPSPNGDGA